jgi:hypothetical protein
MSSWAHAQTPTAPSIRAVQSRSSKVMCLQAAELWALLVRVSRDPPPGHPRVNQTLRENAGALLVGEVLVAYPNWMILATDGTPELSTATA